MRKDAGGAQQVTKGRHLSSRIVLITAWAYDTVVVVAEVVVVQVVVFLLLYEFGRMSAFACLVSPL